MSQRPTIQREAAQVPFGRVALGTLLLIAGLAWLLQTLDVVDVPLLAALAAGLIAIGLAILLVGRHGALVALGVLLTVVLALGSLLDVPFEGGVGERRHRPLRLADLEREYRLAIGQMTVDLRAVELPAGSTGVEASLGIGELIVVVPDDVAVEVDGHAGAGEVVVFGVSESGVSVDHSGSGPGGTAARLQLEASVGLGKVEVRR